MSPSVERVLLLLLQQPYLKQDDFPNAKKKKGKSHSLPQAIPPLRWE